MRWKLLRRRLSISAPRVIVRRHLPWPLRWAFVALVLGFSGAIALWAFELGKDAITLTADDDYRAGAAKDLLETKAVRRGLSLKIFEWGKLEPASGGTVRQEIKLKRGLTSDQAKELAKRIREAFPKTKPVIQGDAVRVSAKSKDELQAVIADLRALDYPIALQFTNYR